MPLRARIAAVASLSVALAVLAAAISLYAGVRSDLRGEIDSQLRVRAHIFTAPRRAPSGPPNTRLGPPRGGSEPRLPGLVEPAPFGAATGYVEFVSAAGRLFVPGGQGTSSAQLPLTGADRAIAAGSEREALHDRTVKGTHLRVLTVHDARGGAVLIARPLTEVEHELRHLLLILALIGAGGILLAALLGAFVARTALAPVGRFTESIETLTGSLDLSHRLDVRGRDELGRLAASFNATLDALERSVAAQRHLIADASHELRTPLASLRANIQLLAQAERLPAEEQAALREDILAELDSLTALVGDVVELARGAEAPAGLDDVRLDEVVRAAVERARRRGELRFRLELEPTVLSGSPDRIGRAVSNLIDNACKWSPPRAAVEVVLRDGLLRVRDHGPGFAETDLPFVFDRFYRAQSARGLPGSGLGLAIVKQAAEAGGGWVRAANAEDGGARLTVSFGTPVASGPSPTV
ncbi:MAG: HAMP domain-containing sensor histidine kinase [Solirubrobacteraceae bacterium]